MTTPPPPGSAVKPRRLALLEAAHLTALGVWLGAVVMAGAVAATVFPAMRRLEPSLPAYANYTGEHWTIAAGHVMARVFWVTDMVQFVAAIIAIATFGLGLIFAASAMRRAATIVRAFLLLTLGASLSYSLLMLAPTMNANLARYWNAAQQGQSEQAAQYREAFEQDHPKATLALSANAALTFAALVIGAWSVATPDRTATFRSSHVAASADPKPEEPLLVRSDR